MKILITVSGYSRNCKAGLKLLQEKGYTLFEIPSDRPYSHEELLPLVEDVDGVIAGAEPWDNEVFDRAKRLKCIVRFGVGYDSVDLEAAKAHHVMVANCPGLNTNAVAEHAMALMLTLLRQVPSLTQQLRQGQWVRPASHELKGKVVGLLGFGAIARCVAKKLSGFEAKVMAFDKFPNYAAAEELGVTMASLEEVLRNADILSIHLPASEETRHLINPTTLAQMKDGALLVNTARGALVDEGSLYQALKSGKLAGCAADVFEAEPIPPDSPLLTLDNYYCTPHVASETYESLADTGLETAAKLVEVFEGKELRNRLA